MLQSYENQKADSAILDKNMAGKKILCHGVPIGASLYGRWHWEQAGLDRYTVSEGKHAEEWASRD